MTIIRIREQRKEANGFTATVEEAEELLGKVLEGQE